MSRKRQLAVVFDVFAWVNFLVISIIVVNLCFLDLLAALNE